MSNRILFLGGRAAAGVLATAFGWGMAGCESDAAAPSASPAGVGKVGATSQAILGGVLEDGSCTLNERIATRHLAIVSRTVASSDQMKICVDASLDDSIFASLPAGEGYPADPDFGLSRQAQLDTVMAAIRSENTLHVTCDATCGGDGCSRVGTFGHDGYEEIDIAPSVLDEAHDALFPQFAGGELQPPDLESMGNTASLFNHEAMHQQGFHHVDGPPAVLGRPYLTQGCVEEIWQGASSNCDSFQCVGPARVPIPVAGAMTWDAQIAIIGTFTPGGACDCVRDPSASSDPTATDPASPVLGINEASEHFGAALCAGDFDGDGFDDLAVGAPGDHSVTPHNATGNVYLYRGTPLGLYPWVVLSTPDVGPGARLGASCAAQDFDEDGFSDLVVGVPGGPNDPGGAFVYKGTDAGLRFANFLNAPDGQVAGDHFAEHMVAGTDGSHPWLAIGSPGRHVNGVQSGVVYAFEGVGVPTTSPNLFTGSQTLTEAPMDNAADGDLFGSSLAKGTLQNGPAESLAVGAPGKKKVFVFPGGDSLALGSPWTPQAEITSPDPAATQFGGALAIGTIHNTVLGSIAIGTPDRARVDIYDGAGTLVQTVTPPANAGSGFGAALSTMNIDTLQGFSDLVVGTPGSNVAHTYLGGFNQIGSRRSLDELGFDLNGADGLGSALAVGDFNGDRVDDLVAGGPLKSPGNVQEAGAIFVYTAKFTDYTKPRTLRFWKVYDQGEWLGKRSVLISAQPSTNGWVINPMPIALSAPNAASGSTINWGSTPALGTTYTGPFALSEGENTIYYTLMDSGGNAEPVSEAIIDVDTRAPTAAVTLSSDYGTLNFTLSDPSPGSGGAGLHAIVTVGSAASAEQFVQGASGTLSVDPSFSYVEYWAEDVAGNQSAHSYVWNYAKRILTDAPAGYWRLGESQPYVALDSSPAGNNGTYVAGYRSYQINPNGVPPRLGWLGAILGDPNTAVDFFIMNDYKYSPPTESHWVTIPDNPSQHITKAISLESWFTMRSPNQSYSALISKSTSNWQDGYGLYYFANTLYFFVNNLNIRVGVPISATSTYHHVVGTYNGSQLSIYLDGALAQSVSYSGDINPSSTPLQIGNAWILGWSGQIDESAIYDKALTARQVSDHFRAGRGLAPAQ